MPEDRLKTGTEGLDIILNGGIPKNHFYLIQGDPGVGKTTLAIQFLLEGIRNNESVYYISLSETKKELQTIAQSHGWDLAKFNILELTALEDQLQLESQNTVFHPAEFELNQVAKILAAEIEKVKPTRIVFDSLSEIRNLAQSALRYRRQMLALKHYFLKHDATVILLDERHSEQSDLHIETLAHGVIALEMWTPSYGAVRRRIRVAKLRGHKYVEGYHDYSICTGGIKLYPRLIASDTAKPYKVEPVSSGVAALDQLVGGGLDRGTSNLFMGPAGSGKSTLSAQYAVEAARRGENVLIYIFDETLENFLVRTDGIQLDIRPFLKKGLIQIIHVDPAELTPGEISHQIREAAEKESIRMLILDSVNGYLNAMLDEKFLALQLHELLTFLNQRGIVSILVMAQHGLVSHMDSPLDITYLADTVVLFRYFEVHGSIKKAISVIKKRSGQHEDFIREYQITGHGIKVGEPLKDFQGVLTGVPTFIGEKKAMLTNEKC